ncbi:hypothetical protein NC652_021111 [Populus alba x Populus x berolinensis]|uniref:Uncharacterized protein n=1 Tax=Populus alba x Populus x berolinensis TaxID=444605 RepID=A0AAD6MLT5_9ROSI|nr:hypothetical protein NC652_021104 [Populus alba x Populus x berolinensis]KAJ6910333.1 hypothetical protein NC652_021111 [Populus alba x Populus x berolinensis]KAJ6987736.1 hypothetical protein NC653_020862 [Populus alba x Populus x berolinensis]
MLLTRLNQGGRELTLELRLVAALPCWVSFFQGKVYVGPRSFTVLDLIVELGLDPPRQGAAMDPDASGVSCGRE